MNTELLKRWVAALRSGEYKQGRGRLQETDSGTWTTSYCCLGVLQHIEPNIPPYKEQELLDPDALGELVGGNILQSVLASMNDEGKDFPYIADYIERKYINNEEDNT